MKRAACILSVLAAVIMALACGPDAPSHVTGCDTDPTKPPKLCKQHGDFTIITDEGDQIDCSARACLDGEQCVADGSNGTCR